MSIIIANMPQKFCAPGKKYDAENNTCLTLSQVIAIKDAFNTFISQHDLAPKNFTGGKIDTIKQPTNLDERGLKKYLLTELHKRMESFCGRDDVCWSKQKFMRNIIGEKREEIMNGTYRPEGPGNSDDWLATPHIVKIMKQYEMVYPNFVFLGAVPLDCDEYQGCVLYNIDYDTFLSQGKTRFGVVFNLDKFGQPGSHWVALYMSIDEAEISFTDSTGNPPNKIIKRVINDFNKFYQSKFRAKPIYNVNHVAYQKDKSECGVYSCNFLIRRLRGESFQDIMNNALTFEEINACRNVYFRNQISLHEPGSRC